MTPEEYASIAYQALYQGSGHEQVVVVMLAEVIRRAVLDERAACIGIAETYGTEKDQLDPLVEIIIANIQARSLK